MGGIMAMMPPKCASHAEASSASGGGSLRVNRSRYKSVSDRLKTGATGTYWRERDDPSRSWGRVRTEERSFWAEYNAE